MTDYFDYGDLKATIIGLTTGIAGFFTAWASSEESETEKVKLDNLAKSDRALIIHGFQGVLP